MELKMIIGIIVLVLGLLNVIFNLAFWIITKDNAYSGGFYGWLSFCFILISVIAKY